MTARSYTASFTVDQTPEEAFAAINSVRGWWTGEIDGPTEKLGDVFTYRYEDLHYSKQEVTESVPGKKVVWRVLDSRLDFVADKSEWNGTRITFKIARKGDKTEVHFAHVGLAPDHECYDACSNAWGSLITKSLRTLITKGKGQPYKKARQPARKER